MRAELPGLLMIFEVFAGIFVLLRALRGWRAGILREAAAVLGLGVAYAAAVIGGPLLAPEVGAFVTLPNFALIAIAGAGAALIAYVLVGLVGLFVFKPTRAQETFSRRLGFGAGGACLGAGIGAFGVWLIILGLRLAGSVAEGRQAAIPAPALAAASSASHGAQAKAPAHTLSDRACQWLADAKRAVDEGPMGGPMRVLDPLPGAVYTNLSKIGQVVSSDSAMDRFRATPAIKELCREPKIAALGQDPAVTQALEARNYVALLQNPRVIAVANDPGVSSRLRALNLGQALDEALK